MLICSHFLRAVISGDLLSSQLTFTTIPVQFSSTQLSSFCGTFYMVKELRCWSQGFWPLYKDTACHSKHPYNTAYAGCRVVNDNLLFSHPLLISGSETLFRIWWEAHFWHIAQYLWFHRGILFRRHPKYILEVIYPVQKSTCIALTGWSSRTNKSWAFQISLS